MQEIRRCSVGEIIYLRHQVLRAGRPIESANLTDDDADGTIHYALFEDAKVVSCLSLMRSELDSESAWQLRGMAVDVDLQGMGLGGRLLNYAMDDARSVGYSMVMWCNARITAVGFYEKYGWKVCSDVFDVPLVGPHFKMKVMF
jgi:predicted GNAT family N-acyltransferase